MKPVAIGENIGGEPAKLILLAEAYRMVTIKEGETQIRVPAIQALFRGQIIAGTKGNRLAARTIMDEVAGVEAEHKKLRWDGINTYAAYKKYWEEQCAHAAKHGLPDPAPVPHPDDIIFDDSRRAVVVAGPQDPREKAEWDKTLASRNGYQEELSVCAAEYRGAKTARDKAMWLNAWHESQRFFDMLNDNLPVRYRKELEDRSTFEGASRPGSEKEMEWPE